MAEVVQARTAFAPAPTTPPSLKRTASPDPPAAASEGDSTTLTTTQTTDVATTSEPPQKKTKLIRRKRRPARPQVDPSALKSEPPPQTGTVFNIWYNKWAGGDREDAYLSKTHAINRCNVRQDSGWTAADKTPGSYFCLFFARGICPKGHECQYLHRLPGTFDIYNSNIDCFGRDKHSDYRDDMGGVGSFLRQNRTLYVGRIRVTDDIEEVVARHFQEWGEVDRIRVLTGRGVAFITYVNEANSQFAKEAMAHQSLDNNEILNVRWATVDPNPLSQKREVARIEEQAAEAVRRALGDKTVRQIEGRETREERDQRRIESGFGLEGYEAPDDVWYARQQQLEHEHEHRRLLDAPQPQPQQREQEIDAEQDMPGNADATPQQNRSTGIFGTGTLAALQAGRANGTPQLQPQPQSQSDPPAKPASSGLGLGAYDSDDDED